MDKPRIRNIEKEISDRKSSLEVLYEQIGNRTLRLEKTVQSHLDNIQRRINTLEHELATINGRNRLPLKSFGDRQVEQFCHEMREYLLNHSGPRLKSYIKSIITEIRVYKSKTKISGRNLQLATVISRYRPEKLINSVPSDITNWRTKEASIPIASAKGPTRHCLLIVSVYD